MTNKLTHEETCEIAAAITQPPYEPCDYLADDPVFRDWRRTTMSLGFFRGLEELRRRGYEVVKKDPPV